MTVLNDIEYAAAIQKVADEMPALFADMKPSQIREMSDLLRDNVMPWLSGEKQDIIAAQVFTMTLKAIALGARDPESLAVAALQVIVPADGSINDLLDEPGAEDV